MSEQENKNRSVQNENAKAGKPVEAKRPNFFVRTGRKISKWFRELKSEAKKVIWPTKDQVLKNTLVVFAVAAVVMVMVYLMDITFGTVRDLIIALVH